VPPCSVAALEAVFPTGLHFTKSGSPPSAAQETSRSNFGIWLAERLARRNAGLHPNAGMIYVA